MPSQAPYYFCYAATHADCAVTTAMGGDLENEGLRTLLYCVSVQN